jgi:predicted ATPase
LAAKKGTLLWKAYGMSVQGFLFALTGKASDAVHMIISGITALRSSGTTWFMPTYLSYLARAYADVGQFDEACRCIGEAMTLVETTKERWCEAEVHRVAGEIALMSPQSDTAKAEEYLERALVVARKQHAKSWELRTAMSMARLWRDQGKRDAARDLLASVYGWFHRRLRHTRSERGQGLARRAERLTTSFEPASLAPQVTILGERSCGDYRRSLRCGAEIGAIEVQRGSAG